MLLPTPRATRDGSATETVDLLPTPSGQLHNDSETLETWRARKARNLAKGINGNGMGTPLPIAVKMLPTPTANDRLNAGYQRRNGKVYKTLPGAVGSAPVPISSAEASPASPSPPPVVAKPKRTTAGSGPSSPVWLASYDRASSSWRTSEGSFPPVNHEGRLSAKSSERWPTWGTTLDGELYALPTPGLLTAENGSSSSRNVPTPTASDHIRRRSTSVETLNFETGKSVSLDRWAEHWGAMLPTPTARDWKDGRAPSPSAPTNGLLGRVIPRLPTPTARLGDPRGAQAKRYTDPRRSNDLDDAVAWITESRSENVQGEALSFGDSTSPRSSDGSA